MPYTDFHYTPTGTGVISGKEVLEQTEDAINDLGGQISGDVQTAIDTANNALNVANTASTDAQNAVNTANTAYTTATNAQNTANAAQTTATNAQTAAQNAQNDVNALGNRVTTAENNITQNTSDISGLTTRMGTAEGNITTLQNDVVTAQATANSAQQTATTARQQSYVFRYSGTAVVPNSTIAYSTIDNTDNIKSGDKILDVDGKLFEITAVDTTNQTVTVGTALIDLALDGDVVHTNRNDNVSIPLNSTSAELGVTGGSTDITFLDKNDKKLSGLTLGSYGSSKLSYVRLSIFDKDVNDNEIQDILEYSYVSNNTNAYLRVYRDNFCTLGSVSYRWKGIYATNYYYGANNVEFSTKFVTTDTAQIITYPKTFTSTPSFTGYPSIRLYSPTDDVNVLPSTPEQRDIRFTDKNNVLIAYFVFQHRTDANEPFRTCWRQSRLDGTNNYYSINFNNLGEFYPENNNLIKLGTSTTRWKDCQTYLINGLTPSSLFMPSDRSARVDISGYFTNTANGNTNTYTVPANGWIYLSLTDVVMAHCFAQTASNLTHYGQTFARANAGQLYCLFPVRKDDIFVSQWYTTTTVTVTNAYFVPCLGNV